MKKLVAILVVISLAFAGFVTYRDYTNPDGKPVL